MKIIESLNINSFRGIRGLEVNDLRSLNIFVGDNNVGKTSILESILLLSNSSFNNILKVCSSRKRLFSLSSFQELYNAFPKKQDNLSLSVSAFMNNRQKISIDLNGNMETVLFDVNEIPDYVKSRKDRYKMIAEGVTTEIKQFNGTLKVENPKEPFSLEEIMYNAYSKYSGRTLYYEKNIIRMHYLSPIDYMYGSVFDRIIKNEEYKKICLEVLKIFDQNIEDLLILRDEDTLSSIEYVKSSKNGLLPLSSYGDGIKKVLAIANGIAVANNGILLIDEIETGLHVKYYDDIFKFILKASAQFNVQLFLTTHSIEAVDGLLSVQEDLNNQEEIISIITLRKTEDGKTISRTLGGKEVKAHRDNFDFEVRI